ncbi:helix-hairpin-helix domain-containing protein [Azospirillum thermophilum]|uniref:Pathogenicity locus n=1 Tax=Azospirillum thermophilum TaxID=2202148 RepID=A0A2S2CTR0_9PROT|nr:helix-hairpin-helix domain-containing protein [Azospirillum thermophilum]AWK87859.1 Pathogenicity locus [Azospirillum thermophilum]
MPFSSEDRARLLLVRGVGPKVVERLEQLGICSLAELARCDAATLCAAAADLVGSSCWKNSPQARSAITAAIAAARDAG